MNDFFQSTLHRLMTGQVRVADPDIDTSDVTDQFPDAGKMLGEAESPTAADHFAEVGKMVRDASSLESVDAGEKASRNQRRQRG